MTDFEDNDPYELEPGRPFWICQACGHIDHDKPMPIDREKFYQRMHEKGSPVCPKCKSEAFVPQGF